MKTILFLCTGNSCRSQMAEGLARAILPGDCKIYSAGIRADGMNPKTVEVMSEIGIDVSKQFSKTMDDLGDVEPDVVVTLCENAEKNCPLYPKNVRHIHWPINDPHGKDVAAYRVARDEIKSKIENDLTL
ncbi:MAG: arsenate reductase [Deltaproteobacteria bacterium CG11_big_fil_rev_8_21_14_0_20_49_13]|nr:MAG: arsenate reductase [Deltaproteobacteria bacterium CG11_big_fil_rev_8_21_14_0_20_49_13]